ncbi:MAG: ATP-binding protein [Chloroflexota bacterium]
MEARGTTPAAADAQSLHDPRPILRLIVLSAVQMLRGSGGAVSLWNAEAQQLRVEASYQLDQAALATIHPRLDSAILEHLGEVGHAVQAVWLHGAERRGPRGAVEQILALPLSNQDGSLVGVIYVFRDRSAPGFEARDLELLDLFARQAAAAIAQASLAAATIAEKNRLEALQSSFVSIVSHELQTPVAIIKAYAGTLSRPDAAWNAQTVIRVAHTIEEECDRLHRLIASLLDLSRIQAGRVAMTVGPVDLVELAQDVAERNAARSQSHHIQTSFPAEFPVIRGDREKLRQALANLVDNALKYSPEGGVIEIGGRVEPGSVVVTVSDQGIGIPPEEHEHVFERFHRVDTRLSRATQGAGLGLYICKVIVEAHGGQIWVESSDQRQGSTFHIRLPR